MEEMTATRTPWHLWVIGIVSLLWNGGGAYDYVMTQTRNMDYLASGAETLGVPVDIVVDYYTGFPVWADFFWALGVWGAVAGSILLLLRSRYAFHAFVVGFVGLIGTSVYTFGTEMPEGMASPFVYVFSAVIVIITLLLIWYARRMAAKGVLR